MTAENGDGHKGQALIYCRTASESQGENTSLNRQETACVEQAENLGYTVGRITREVASGIKLAERPLLSRDREDLKSGEFGALIVYCADRLSRDQAHLATIAEECSAADIDLITVVPAGGTAL
jgi:DNA invertase Pin-like site-specific DNA recombinase